ITRSLAQELGPRKIRVNAVNPGVIGTEGLHAAGISGSDFQRQVEAQTPLGRLGRPQDVAPAVVFLASAESAYTTWETLYIAGGLRCSGTGTGPAAGRGLEPLPQPCRRTGGGVRAPRRGRRAPVDRWVLPEHQLPPQQERGLERESRRPAAPRSAVRDRD